LRTSITCLVVLVAAMPAHARIINVPADYPTIQAGIDASVNGDTVLVAPGEYPEILTVRGQAITLTSSNGPEETTIVGYLTIRDFADTSGCVLRGFMVFDPNNDPFRGRPGIIVRSGKPRIIGNIIKHHYQNSTSGGGVYLGGGAVISHNIIEDNYAMQAGGGIELGNASDVEVSYNIIRNNRSGYGLVNVGVGAGISGGRGRVSYNLIYGNNVRCIHYPGWPPCGDGGGVYAFSAKYYNNTIVNNTAIETENQADGGGVFAGAYSFDSLRIVNNIIAFNNRGGLALQFYSPESLYTIPDNYNLLYGNTAYDYSAPETSQTNIFADPLFADTAFQDYSLQAGSPCIDAGDPSFPLDPDSTRVDIGALFFDQRVSIDDSLKGAAFQFELRQNYPNPFNAQTTIMYNLPSASRVSLTIFDITGKIARRLVGQEYQAAGQHHYTWDGTDNSGGHVSTGIYFYQLKVEDNRIIKCMILIK